MDDKKKELIANRMVMLQTFADGYLRFYKGKSFAQMYPDVEDKYGLLNKEQELVLHDFLVQVYKSFGLDLDKVLKENKAEVKPGNNLTDFEMVELIRLADAVLLLDGVLLERKDRLLHKNNKE